MTGVTTVDLQRFECWKGLNRAAMILGAIIAYIISSKLPPSTPAFMATLFMMICLMIVAASLSFRGIEHDSIPLRERYAFGAIVTLIVIVAGSAGGQIDSLVNVLHHMM